MVGQYLGIHVGSRWVLMLEVTLYQDFTKYIPFFTWCQMTWSLPLEAGVFVIALTSLGQKRACNSSISRHSRVLGMKRSPTIRFSSPSTGGVIDSCHNRVIRNQQNLYPKFLLLP